MKNLARLTLVMCGAILTMTISCRMDETEIIENVQPHQYQKIDFESLKKEGLKYNNNTMKVDNDSIEPPNNGIEGGNIVTDSLFTVQQNQ